MPAASGSGLAGLMLNGSCPLWGRRWKKGEKTVRLFFGNSLPEKGRISGLQRRIREDGRGRRRNLWRRLHVRRQNRRCGPTGVRWALKVHAPLFFRLKAWKYGRGFFLVRSVARRGSEKSRRSCPVLPKCACAVAKGTMAAAGQNAARVSGRCFRPVPLS